MPKISTVLIVVLLSVLAFRSYTSVFSAPPAQETVAATVIVLPPPPASATVSPTPAPSLSPTRTAVPSRTASPTITPSATRTATPTATTGIIPGPGDRTYTVAAGDNPWLIATKLYGNGFFYQYILNANRLTEKSILQVGMVLVIPPLPTPTLGPGTPSATPAMTVTLSSASTPTAAPVSSPPAPTTAPATGLAPVTPGAGAVPPVSQLPVPTPAAGVAGTQDPATRLLADAAKNPQLPLILDVLAWVCIVGSLVCAWMSYQTYHRMRILRRMMIMSARARARL